MHVSTLVSLTPAAAVYALHDSSALNPLNEAFARKVEALLDVLYVPGVSVAVLQGDKIASKGYGFQQLPNIPATADTLYYTGSTTKAFVAAAVGMMVQNGSAALRWSTTMADLLAPDFALIEEYQSLHTTLEDALSHRSGLPRHDLAYGWDNATVFDMVKRMKYLPLTAEPRTLFQYCNTMYGAVGAVLERHTGRTLEDVLRTWIWEPLGMRSTGFKASNKADLARGYFWSDEDSYYVPEKYIDLSSIAGAGATVSSVNDYSLWVKALLSAAEPNLVNRTNPISTTLFAEVTAPRSILPKSWLPVDVKSTRAPMTYALGWQLEKVGPYNVIGHGGGLDGFATEVFLVPELKLGFVSMANAIEGPSANLGKLLFLEVLQKISNISLPPSDLHVLQTASSHMLSKDISVPQPWQQASSATKAANTPWQPLPGEADSYAGLYSHPAYGIFNISLVRDSKKSHTIHNRLTTPQLPLQTIPPIKDRALFQVKPSPRVWPSRDFVLAHETFTTFELSAATTHGPSGETVQGCNQHNKHCEHNTRAEDRPGRVLECRNVDVTEYDVRGKAIFEHGLNGEVQWFGAELEPEMVRKAAETPGPEVWKKAMIWFEKVA